MQAMANAATIPHDKHHCRCFGIDRALISKFRDMLVSHSFESTLQVDHGQVFGLRRRMSEYKQVHVKVMPDGSIESETEPPPEYPFAHINQTHSYSSHHVVRKLLRGMKIPYSIVGDVPDTCLRPVVVLPKSPTEWKTIAGLAGAAAGLAISAYLLWKKR